MPHRFAFRILIAGLLISSAFAGQKEKSMLKDKYVKVNGVRLHYVTAGKGPLILFLHGFPEFWYEWKNQLADFGKTTSPSLPICAVTTFLTSRRTLTSIEANS